MSMAGSAEIAFIALLAFIIIGPKDLPKFFFTLGRFIQTLRRLSQEFMAEFEAIRHIQELQEEKSSSPKRTPRKSSKSS